LAAFCDFDQ
jgi:hypothetical protein